MKWLVVNARNFYGRSFSWSADATGLIAVTGVNGAGKSTTFNEPIAWGLYGKTLRGTKPGPDAQVDLQIGDLTVIRSKGGLTWSYKDKTVALAEGPKKAQAELDELLRLSFDEWRKASVFSTYDASRFSDATDAERKGALEAMLGLGAFEEGLRELRLELKAKRDGAAKIANAREGLAAQLEVAAGDLAQALDEQEALFDAPAEECEAVIGDIEKLRADADAKREKLSAAETTWAAAQADRELARKTSQRLQTTLFSLKRPEASCTACGRPFANAAEAQAHFDAETEKLQGEYSAARDEVAGTEARFRAESTALAEARNAEKLARWELRDAEATRNRVEGAATARRAAVEALDARVAQLTSRVEALRAKLDDANAAAAKASEVIGVYEAAEKVLGLQGARNALFHDSLKMLETAVNEVFDAMDWPGTVEFRTWTEKAKGGVSDKLSLVLSGIGAEVYDGASGGERRRIDAALVLALADIYADACPLTMPLLFDDTFDTLDADGRSAIARVLRARAKARPIIVITQSDDLVAECSPDWLFRVAPGGTVAWDR